MKVRHVRSSRVVGACVALLALSGCSPESADHRRARLSAIATLAEIRARLPQYHEDSLVVGRDTARVVFRAWLDGAQLAILHEEVHTRSMQGRDRFYLVDGALLACSTSSHEPRGKYRDLETTALFDPKGRPLMGWVQVDGQRRFASTRQLETIRAMHEQVIKSFWEDYTNPKPGH